MAILELDQLPPRGPLLGLDPGTKTIGIAAADGLRMIASPVETIKKGKKLAPALTRLFELYDDRVCVGLVIGLPVNMDGSHGPRVQAVRALARNILEKRDVPIAFWDERLSTAAVERTLLEADTSRAKRAEVIDKMAAAYILQGAIDRLSN
ncbi:Holliday junction resolvase RuvX [Hirschia baltica]|uniref:Putative pre-16S rRNA nuclease n=1 Tax=Hirschia baltica (strain ATCC 49814 / DSM 5838 / IFAM 1418) TaxID=582402 RepID=C6XKV1_HIRBI|nr:Holliday junction resolvase RuvX [Hirschia baltica]ACT59668.1 Holliday junction resolvase YqgF [Hirschia baltica ATCC 49814]